MSYVSDRVVHADPGINQSSFFEFKPDKDVIFDLSLSPDKMQAIKNRHEDMSMIEMLNDLKLDNPEIWVSVCL